MNKTFQKRGPALPRFVRDLLASPPKRGGGLNLWFYRVARALHGYRSPAEIVEVLKAATAGKPVRHGEIERAVDRSGTCMLGGVARSVSRVSPWPNVNTEQREAVIASSSGLVDLWERSPVRFGSDRSHAEEVIDALFPGNPLLCIGQSTYNFATRPRADWRGQLGRLQFIVPSPMTACTGCTQDGKESSHALEITGPRRFLVIEQDDGTLDEQSGVLLHLAERAPLAVAVHSGSKSIHGWFYCEGRFDEKLHGFMRYAVSLGADRATWTRSQFVRMPDGKRATGKRQTIYFFNPEVLQ